MPPRKYKDLRLTQGSIVPGGLRKYTSQASLPTLVETLNFVVQRDDGDELLFAERLRCLNTHVRVHERGGRS